MGHRWPGAGGGALAVRTVSSGWSDTVSYELQCFEDLEQLFWALGLGKRGFPR
jgi:hypothetical protein